MKQTFFTIVLLFMIGGYFFACKSDGSADESGQVEVWLTKADGTVKFQKQQESPEFGEAQPKGVVIEVDTATAYQSMDGFGYTLTGGSAALIHQMEPQARQNLLQELFSTEGNGIGVSYLRVSIGASDLSDHVFSYCDVPAGQTDPELKNFDLGPDKEHLIPLLKEILAISPDLKILGSPWSPPVWMKTNQKSVGGSLKPEFYPAYAQYFVKYIQAMEAEGIPVDAITVQNEPLHPGNNPSLLMPAADQAEFVKKHLGPAFEAAGVDTKIIIYDHNADRIDYPTEILSDSEAAQYVDGTAFHLYGGKIEDLSQLHNMFPDKNLYFTEQWVGAPGDFASNLTWHVKNLIIGASRNWCKTVLEWNLASDPNQDPHTEGGCTECLGAVTIAGNQAQKNVAWYIIAHASKFVRPGSVRAATNMPDGLPNVGFKTPDGKKVLIVQNESETEKEVAIRVGERNFQTRLPAQTVATYVWSR
ncbi:MAG: glycoside hydrolase family 30 beta sandwich domain-containing protein [Prolixibacteraceae bacterium]